MALNRITESLQGKPDNYILPFFWQHGEPDEIILEEVHAIYNSGIRSMCIESRDYDGFASDEWFHTLDIIFAECEKLGMTAWLLDDSSFPTGGANGGFRNHPDLAACGIGEQHVDVTGPVKGGAVHVDWFNDKDDELIAILACERVLYDEALTGKVIDITNNVHGDMVYFDLPKGCYRIMFIYKTRSGMAEWGRRYADMLNEASIDILIKEVYEKHYQRYKKYFGNVFQGFFSDEPCLCNNTKHSYIPDFGIKYCHFPWRSEFLAELSEKVGGDFREYLPSFWFDMGDKTAKARFEYMDLISKRYSKAFTWKLGNWCRDHGVMYIGHVIEDMDQHAKTGGGDGHFFRALDGQDMAGIDTVLGQNIPGQTDHITRVPCSYDVSDPDMFSFTLPKLASSHAHVQPLKKGRAMCEIYGAYSWQEGLKMMKWMTDLMLVSGINHYVPHAFSPRFPEWDCPPHMYARGSNPEFKKFRILMDYTNRMCHLLNGGIHVPSAAVLYHAEAEWASKNFMVCDKVARLLTENQLDYDIISADYLKTAEISRRKFKINGETYPCLIVPESKYLPLETLKAIYELSNHDIYVIYANSFPKGASDAPDADISLYVTPSDRLHALSMSEIVLHLRSNCKTDVIPTTYSPYLRYYHYDHGETKLYMFSNTNIHEDVSTDLVMKNFDFIGDYAIYDVLENKITKHHTDTDTIHVELKPYNSLVYIFGELPADIPTYVDHSHTDTIVLDENYSVSTVKEEKYPDFKHYKNITKLVNMMSKDEQPRFSGHYLYEKTFDFNGFDSENKYVLDLGYVGECATLYLNDVKCGDKMAPPYEFDITSALKNGENKLAVEVTTHYGYELHDMRTKYFLIEPAGLVGEVTLKTYKKN